MRTAIKWLKYFAVGFCLALMFTCRSFGADAPMSVEGVVKKDATWTGAVLVQGDVLVPEGVTLTIMPGAHIMFMPSDSTKIEPMFLSMQTELLVRGRLMALGKPDGRISFGPAPETLSGKKPERGDWGGIIFDGARASASVVSNADIEKSDTGVAMYGSSPAFDNCRMEDDRYGVVCAGGSSPRLTSCTVTGCEFGVTGFKGGRAALEGCTVKGNGQDFLTKE